MFTNFDAISALVEDASFIVEEDNSITWLSTNKRQPSEEEIQLKIAELEEAEPMRLLRSERDQLIATTDWRATVDYPGSDQAAWLTYRQALRDLPANSTPSLDDNGQLTGVTWPTPPE
jgi:hypothetical protein